MNSSPSRKCVFRVDASIDIGTGHVMRCLTLAGELKDKGFDCYFICREHPGNLISLISEHGYQVYTLPMPVTLDLIQPPKDELHSSHFGWLGTSWEKDAQQTKDVLADISVDWMIIDHYALDIKWETVLQDKCRRLMVIDDLADRPHSSDLLLDQNLGREPSNYCALVPDSCLILAGPKYALLRPEFADLRERSLERRKVPELKRILISMGGVDKDNITGKILVALNACQLSANCKITVIMGQSAPWLKEVFELANLMQWPTDVQINVSDMGVQMFQCDLAIGAAGSTSWERCCLGIPSLIVVLAANQREIATALHDVGAARTISSCSLHDEILLEINTIMNAISRLGEFSKAASKITDGQGAKRVVSSLQSINPR